MIGNGKPGSQLKGERNRIVSRREFLYTTVAAAGSVVLAACSGGSNNNQSAQSPAGQKSPEQLNFAPPPKATPTQAGAASAAQPTSGAMQVSGSTPTTTAQAAQTPTSAPTLATPKKFSESPKLADKAKSGQLPEVAERLPKNPLVVQPVEKVGTYGGEWNTSFQGPADAARLTESMDYEHLVRWAPDFNSVIPNIAESYEVAKKGAEYTFKLREGMKWSDGKPFTADDIVFWYEDVFSNQNLTPVQSPWYMANSKPVKVKKQDDYTVVFDFPAPNGLFIQYLASVNGGAPTQYPAHYMKQFHKKYNPKVVQEAKKQQMDHWMDLFANKASFTENSDKPVLFGWKLTQPLGKSTQQVTTERNPYYWKVDTEGNQLPYLDSVVFATVSELDVMVLKALNGEVDMQIHTINTLQNKSVFYKSRQKGNYHFIKTIPDNANSMVIMLNQVQKDETKRKIFRNLDFRIGLSYALDRQEIIDVVFVSQGKPWQVAPREGSELYDEKLAKQYTEHNLDKANQHLDKVLPKKNAQGKRLGPDGKPFTFRMEYPPTYFNAGAQPLNLVKKYWGQVGIDIEIKPVGQSLWFTHLNGGEYESTVWHGDPGLTQTILLDPRWYMPAGYCLWGMPWQTWYASGGKEGVEPPAAAKQQMKLYDKVKATPDTDEQIKLMKQIFRIAQEQFWVMGVTLPIEGYGIVKNSFHNVPETMPDSWLYPSPAPTNPCQYFTDDKK